MKLISCVIRPERLPAVKEALFRAGVTGITITRATGHGGERDIVTVRRGTKLLLATMGPISFHDYRGIHGRTHDRWGDLAGWGNRTRSSIGPSVQAGRWRPDAAARPDQGAAGGLNLRFGWYGFNPGM
jgi:hypothetical protein